MHVYQNIHHCGWPILVMLMYNQITFPGMWIEEMFNNTYKININNLIIWIGKINVGIHKYNTELNKFIFIINLFKNQTKNNNSKIN